MTDKKVSELNDKQAQEGVCRHYHYPYQVTPIEPTPMVKILNQNATILKMNEEILKHIVAEPKVSIIYGGGGSGGGGHQAGKVQPAGPAQDDSKGYDGASYHAFGRTEKVFSQNTGGGVEGFGGACPPHAQQTSLATPGGGGNAPDLGNGGGKEPDSQYKPVHKVGGGSGGDAVGNAGGWGGIAKPDDESSSFEPIGYPR